MNGERSSSSKTNTFSEFDRKICPIIHLHMSYYFFQFLFLLLSQPALSFTNLLLVLTHNDLFHMLFYHTYTSFVVVFFHIIFDSYFCGSLVTRFAYPERVFAAVFWRGIFWMCRRCNTFFLDTLIEKPIVIFVTFFPLFFVAYQFFWFPCSACKSEY